MKKIGSMFKNPFSKSSKSSSKSRKSSMAPSISANSYASINLTTKNYNINNSDLGKIHLAVCEQNMTKVKKYIANINELDKLKRTALHFAAAFGNEEIVQFLLTNDASIILPDHDLKTPLMKAIECHHERCAELMIEKGISKKIKFDATDNDGNNVLHYICQENLLTLIPLFFNERTIYLADKQNKQGKFPLHLAVERNYSEVINQLLEHEINVNLQDSFGMTPLMHACAGNFAEIVETLVNYDADLTLKNKDGMTAEAIAKKRGHEECLNLILNGTNEQDDDDAIEPPDYDNENEDEEMNSTKNAKDHEMGYIEAKKINHQLSMTQSINDLEDTVNDIETFRSHIDNNIEDENSESEELKLSKKESNLENLNNATPSKLNVSNTPYIKPFTNETKAFGFTYKPEPLQSEKSDWDDSISECSDFDKINPPTSKSSKIQNTPADINPPDILKKSTDNSYLFDSDEEKSNTNIPDISTIKLQPNISKAPKNNENISNIQNIKDSNFNKFNSFAQNSKIIEDKDSKSDWDSTDTEADNKTAKFSIQKPSQKLNTLDEGKKIVIQDLEDLEEIEDINNIDVLDKSINDFEDFKAINDIALKKFQTSQSSLRRNSENEDNISQRALSRVGSIRSDIESVQVNLLEDQVKKLQGRLDAERNEKISMEQRRKTVEKEKDLLLEKMENLTKEKNILEASKRQIEMNYERLQKQLEEEKNKLKITEIKHKEEVEVDDWLETNDDSNTLTNLQKQIEDLKKACDVSKLNVSQAESQINELTKELSEVKFKNKQAEDSLNAKEEELQNNKLEMDRLQQSKVDLQKELEISKHSDYNIDDTLINELKKELEISKNELKMKITECTELQKLKFELTKELEDNSRQSINNIDKTQINQLKRELEACQLDLKNKTAECTGLQSLNSSMKEIIERKDDLMKNAHHDQSAMFIKIQEENDKLRIELQSKLNELSIQVNQRDQTIHENINIVNNLKLENESFKRDLEATKTEKKNLSIDLNDIRRKFEETSSRLNEELLKNKELLSQCTQLKDDLDESKIKCVNLQTRIKEIKAQELTEIDENRLQLNLMRLEEKLRMSEDANHSVSKQVTEWMTKYSKLETEQILSEKEKANLLVEIQQEKWKVEKSEEINKYSETRFKIELERQQEQYLGILKQLENELKSYEDKNQTLSIQVTDWLTKATKLDSELSFIKRISDENEDKLTQEKKKIKKCIELKNSAELRLKAEQERNEFLSNENDNLKLSLRSAKKKLRLNEKHLHKPNSNNEIATSSDIEEYSQFSRNNNIVSNTSAYDNHLNISTMPNYSHSTPSKYISLNSYNHQRPLSASQKYINQEIEKFRIELQKKADDQLNDKLREVNMYLERQAQSRARLEQMHESNENNLILNFEIMKNNLKEELNRLYKLHNVSSQNNKNNREQVINMQNNIHSILNQSPSNNNSNSQMKKELLNEFSRIIKKHLDFI